MKRILIILAALLVLVLAGIGAAWLSINRIVKAGVERGGPMVVHVPVTLGGAQVSLRTGDAVLSDLLVGNPQGYLTPSSIQTETIRVNVDLATLFKDKVHVRSIQLLAPQITFEGVPGENNLGRILQGMQAFAGDTGEERADRPGGATGPRLQIDEFAILGARLRLHTPLTGDAPVTLDVEDIRLRQLGQGPGGITAGELVQRALTALVGSSTNLVGTTFRKIGMEAIEETQRTDGREGDPAFEDVAGNLQRLLGGN